MLDRSDDQMYFSICARSQIFDNSVHLKFQLDCRDQEPSSGPFPTIILQLSLKLNFPFGNERITVNSVFVNHFFFLDE